LGWLQASCRAERPPPNPPNLRVRGPRPEEKPESPSPTASEDSRRWARWVARLSRHVGYPVVPTPGIRGGTLEGGTPQPGGTRDGAGGTTAQPHHMPAVNPSPFLEAQLRLRVVAIVGPRGASLGCFLSVGPLAGILFRADFLFLESEQRCDKTGKTGEKKSKQEKKRNTKINFKLEREWTPIYEYRAQTRQE